MAYSPSAVAPDATRSSCLSLKFGIRRALQLSSALVLSVGLAPAQAQQSAGVLEEIIVTAQKQSEEINRVPLSITAVTQSSLDEQGIKSAADLTRYVPGLSAVGNIGGQQQTFSIRGIIGGTGAATTSVYLDDTNLTKRANGGVAQNNGVILPLLYDLERVEVLKGPQGTLYGGSSEGGTVRYITPTPSLTEYSGSVRVEGSSIGSRGELSNEISGAFGGPIVDDKLGFRISGIRRDTGGWIDVYSAYTNQLIREDANSTLEWAGRAALLWKITDNASAQLSAYHVDNKNEGGSGSSTAIYVNRQLAPNATFTVDPRCINTVTGNQRTATLAQPGGAPAASFIPVSTAAPCGTNTYTRPGATYGPFITGQDISLATGRQDINASTSQADIVSLTLNYNFSFMSVKSITSYLGDEGTSDTTGGEEWSSTTGNAGQFTTSDTRKGFPLFQAFYNATGGRGNTGSFNAFNKRHGIEEELRFSSEATERFNWVAGMFYSNTKTHILYQYLTDPAIGDLVMQLMYGPNMGGPAGNTSASAARYGVINDMGFQARLNADINDKELAFFGEANYWVIPDTLKVTAGIRYSKADLEYNQLNYGQFSGRLPDSLGALTAGSSSDKPVTPKVGVQYQINSDNMTYVTAGKGFRAGGVNAQISQTICATFLTPLGLTAADVPPDYGPDTVWSYELGGKFRLFEQLRINLAVFRIDWKDIQATTTLGCGQGFTTNGGRARSEGAELQVQYQPLQSLGMYLNAGYNDAYYIDPVLSPRGPGATAAPTPSLNAGDKLNVAPWQISAGIQYDFTVVTDIDGYARLDGTYQNSYDSGATFGTTGYGANYFLHNSPSRQQLNLRAGVRVETSWDVNFFVQNLLNKETQVAGFGDGRGACSATSVDCSTYLSYNPFVTQTFMAPRKFGLQATYKF